MIKVLFTSNYNNYNVYLKEIVDPLKDFCEVICSVDAFWHSNLSFDIIHFQWPEEIISYKSINENLIEKVKNRVNYWKSKGTKLVATRHNEIPHRKWDFDRQYYDYIYSAVDAVVHLGDYSRLTLGNPQAHNVVIEHPNYLSLVEQIPQSLAQKKINFPIKGKVFLSFGDIRKPEEEAQIISAFKKIANKKKVSLIICKSKLISTKPPFRRQPFKSLMLKIKFYYYRKFHNIFLSAKKINNEELKYYFCSADVIISPRIDSINSGVIYLAFSFGKPIIGPSIGNMKGVLNKTGNPSFEPKNIDSLTEAMNSALRLGEKLGKSNIDYVLSNPNKNIAEQHFTVYDELIDGNN